MKPLSLKLGLVALMLSIFSFVIISCSKSESSTDTSKLEVKLTDAPGEFAALWVKVSKIRIHTTDDTDTEEKEGSGWTSYDVSTTGYINLLKYSNGDEIALINKDLPVGKITEIRLVLDETSKTYLKLKGATDSIEVATPSAKHSGLKIKINTELTKAGNCVVVLDFDVAKGLKEYGKGKYRLNPVLRALIRKDLVENYGTILGNITPMSANPSVHVLSGVDTIATAIPRIDGIFKIRGLADGTYSLAIDVVTGSPTTISNVVVSKGVVTNVGTITLK